MCLWGRLVNALLCRLITGMQPDRSNRGVVTHTAAAAVHKKTKNEPGRMSKRRCEHAATLKKSSTFLEEAALASVCVARLG